MRIIVFGAAGTVGSRVVSEALSRGHDVTAAVRNVDRARHLPPAARLVVADAADVENVVTASTGHDVLVTTTRPAPGREPELVTTARVMLAAAARTGIRLLMVGGAASLTLPGTDATVLDSPAHVSDEYRAIARACAEQFAVCRSHREANWTYLSPPALLLPGTRTGRYRLGTDELLTDPDGNSTISVEDLALALLDEAEQPRHERRRFTVAY